MTMATQFVTIIVGTIFGIYRKVARLEREKPGLKDVLRVSTASQHYLASPSLPLLCCIMLLY
jgi:fructose-1,6-bisphosphatase